MYRVLLPIDENEDRALRSAETLVSFPGTDEIEAVLLNVFESFDVSDSEGGAVSSEDIFDRADPPASLEAVQVVLDEYDISYETRHEHGRIVETILHIVDEAAIDHIVLSGRKHTPVGKVLFGSVVQAVILDAEVPVTVVGRPR